MGSDPGVQPAGVEVVAHKVWAGEHVQGVVHVGADLPADDDVTQGHHHRTDGSLPGLALGKQVPKLWAKQAQATAAEHAVVYPCDLQVPLDAIRTELIW